MIGALALEMDNKSKDCSEAAASTPALLPFATEPAAAADFDGKLRPKTADPPNGDDVFGVPVTAAPLRSFECVGESAAPLRGFECVGESAGFELTGLLGLGELFVRWP